MKRLALGLVLACASPLEAQSVVTGLGFYFPDSTRTTFRLGINQPLFGPLGFGIYGTMIQGRNGSANAWGAESDLSLFRGGDRGLYLIGSLGGGVMPSDDMRGWWTWSAGAGWDLYPTSWLTLSLEGRWRIFHPGEKKGAELGLKLAFGHGYQRGSAKLPSEAGDVSMGASTAPPPRVPLAIKTGTATARDQLISNVLQTAQDEMGTPYKWGGEDGNGFDCSGLIQYSYGHEGVSLPRRSLDQAREGTAVERSLDALLPGDILTFRSSPKGSISHVGLYLGDGRFIHSARGGVQISALSPDDPYGKWWWQRWAGARRVVALPGSE
ncbi:MAG TPA: C40 family peptidase [Gemmatimonadales bacterium]|nr:C40 family peptidase [Gemmatimonadales bacterium]